MPVGKMPMVEASTLYMYDLLVKWGTVIIHHKTGCLSFCVSICLSVCLSVHPSGYPLSMHLLAGSQTMRQSISQSVSQSAIPSFVCLDDVYKVPSPLSISTAECDLPQAIC